MKDYCKMVTWHQIHKVYKAVRFYLTSVTLQHPGPSRTPLTVPLFKQVHPTQAKMLPSMKLLVALSIAQGVISSPISLESKAEVVSSPAVKVARNFPETDSCPPFSSCLDIDRHFPKTDSCPPFSSCSDVTAEDEMEAAIKSETMIETIGTAAEISERNSNDPPYHWGCEWDIAMSCHEDTDDEAKIEARTETDQATVLSAEKPRDLFDFPGPKCSEDPWC